MKKIFPLLFVSIMVTMASACSVTTKTVTLTGDSASEKYDAPSGFTGDTAYGVVFKNMSFDSGSLRILPTYKGYSVASTSDISSVEKTLAPYLQITAPSDFFTAGFTIDYSGNTITLSSAVKTSFKGKGILFDLYANVTSLNVEGGISCALDLSRSENFDLTVSGAINLTCLSDFVLKRFTTSLSGTGNLVLSGSVTSLNYAISGTASINGEKFSAQDAVVNLSGVGTVSVRAEKTLDVTFSGSGVITYYGNPEITKNLTGLGTLKAG